MSEVLVCDTSVVRHVLDRWTHPERHQRWSDPTLDRLEAKVLAISVVTLAEMRSGFLMGGWGERRKQMANRDLERFLHLPVDDQDAEEWARLRAAARSRGVAIGVNDLWIAAAASVREHVLVTCDRDHERIAGEMPVEVVFLAPPV